VKEQRAHARKLMHEQAYLADANLSSWVPVVLVDISVCGISFASPAVIIGDAPRQLQFRMPGSPLVHRALIRVVHHSTSGAAVGFKVGARFEEISTDTRNAITAFVGTSVPCPA